MQLKPLDSTESIEIAAGWIAEKDNYKWLDFGQGRQPPTPLLIKIMTQKDTHVLRLFTTDEDNLPIGVVGLNNLNRLFRTATLWIVVGDKSRLRRGYATRASSKMLDLGFRELGLHTINTWIVDGNPSIRVAERLNFRFVGRQRECHFIDGRRRDRLMFDLLASEYSEYAEI